ncbi:type II toxin-antitoxin system RelE/ParE family toxin [Salmonella enterica]|nr:type II toxin-antitoxin system RelE/ParE family toxin [Salmonella enterica]
MGNSGSVYWETDSLEDRSEIFEYLYDANPVAAEKTDDIIESSGELLGDNPKMGVKKSGFPGRCLVLSDVPFNIYYDWDGKNVRILRVLHQKRQFPKPRLP